MKTTPFSFSWDKDALKKSTISTTARISEQVRRFGRAGQEDEVPASDNAPKLKRSCESAEHVGGFFLKFVICPDFDSA